MTEWRALLDGELRDEAMRAARAIGAELFPVDASGAPADETALTELVADDPFTILLADALIDAGQEELMATLQHMLNEVAGQLTQRRRLGLYGGIMGNAWLVTSLLDFDEEEDPLVEVDRQLIEAIRSLPTDAEFDLISGLAGFAVYFADRQSETAADGLTLVVDRLAARARREETGVTWFKQPELVSPFYRENAPDGCYDLGVAHGVAGVIYCLARAVQLDAHPDADELLESSFEWLMAVGEDAPFSSWLVPGREASPPARVAWCYGDLGIGAMLCAVSALLDRPAWQAAGISVASRAVQRPERSDGVADATLCHGALGNAHLFNRLYQYTGQDQFAAAAQRDFRRGLAMREPSARLGGFRTHTLDNEGKPVRLEQAGFLEGSSGIALTLLAGAGLEPAWDRLLGLS